MMIDWLKIVVVAFFISFIDIAYYLVTCFSNAKLNRVPSWLPLTIFLHVIFICILTFNDFYGEKFNWLSRIILFAGGNFLSFLIIKIIQKQFNKTKKI
jgi:hypothetical protein